MLGVHINHAALDEDHSTSAILALWGKTPTVEIVNRCCGVFDQ